MELLEFKFKKTNLECVNNEHDVDKDSLDEDDDEDNNTNISQNITLDNTFKGIYRINY